MVRNRQAHPGAIRGAFLGAQTCSKCVENASKTSHLAPFLAGLEPLSGMTPGLAGSPRTRSEDGLGPADRGRRIPPVSAPWLLWSPDPAGSGDAFRSPPAEDRAVREGPDGWRTPSRGPSRSPPVARGRAAAAPLYRRRCGQPSRTRHSGAGEAAASGLRIEGTDRVL